MGEASLESKLVAEALGVFALTFIGAGTIIVGNLNQGEASLLTVAIAHGVVLAIAVSATMNISGGHINPAITIAFLMTRRIDGATAGMYIVAQLVGGIVAGGILFFIFGADHYGGTPAPGVIEGVTLSASKVVAIEIVLTFLLMFAIMGTAVDSRAPAIGGWGIGLMVTVDILMGGPLTGAAMNPARHLGTALFEGLLADAWMYWVGPIIGAGICALLYERFLMAEE